MGSLPNLTTIGSSPRPKNQPCRVGRGWAQVSWHPCSKTTGHHQRGGHVRVHHTRSDGNEYAIERNISDMQQQSISPASARNSRLSTRRRESLTSSAGASSVRRLVAQVRSASGPLYTRRMLVRNLAALGLAHATATACLAPSQALQASVTAWLRPHWTPEGGSRLLALAYLLAALSSLCAPFLLSMLGARVLLIIGYFALSIFYSLHLFPTKPFMIIAYTILGLFVFAVLAHARITFLMTLATKLSYVISADEQELNESGKSEALIHKLSRMVQIAQDFGLVAGNAIVAWLLWYTLPDLSNTGPVGSFSEWDDGSNTTWVTFGPFLWEAMFPNDEQDQRICGAALCTTSESTYSIERILDEFKNGSIQEIEDDREILIQALPCKTQAMLSSVFLGCSGMALAITLLLQDRIQSFTYQDPVETNILRRTLKDLRDSFCDRRLQLTAPLALFIGLEQGFMLADFTKSYVACCLGVPTIALVFLSLGALQGLAGFTLSLLLLHIRRHWVVVVGAAFHGLLLMVLLLWKPAGDDAALFYVIAAAWGVCNAIWETLHFSFLMNIYPDSWQSPCAILYFYRFTGLALSLSLHGILCNWLKLYILAFSLVTSIIPYVYLETRLSDLRQLSSL